MSASPASIEPQLRHSGGFGKRRIRSAIARERLPDIRTTPIPPRPGGVEIATMVSWVFIGAGLGLAAWRGGRSVCCGLCRHPDRGVKAAVEAAAEHWAFLRDTQSP